MSHNENALVLTDKVYWTSLAAVLVLLFVYQWLSGTSAGLDPDSVWEPDRVQDTPVWLRIWLTGFVTPAFLLSIFFVWRHAAARWVLGAFVVSHIPIVFDFGEITVGMVGWLHLVCWTPALIMSGRERSLLPLGSLYGVYLNAAIAVLSISLVYDAISAVRYVIA